MSNSLEAKDKSRSIREIIRTHWSTRNFLGIVVGAIVGYLYYHFVGCSSGSCGITSNPYLSTIGGGFLGYFLLNSPCSRGAC